MSRARHVTVGRWIALIAGVLVAIKSLIFCVRRIFRITRNEMQARGTDETFLLNMAARRRSG